MYSKGSCFFKHRLHENSMLNEPPNNTTPVRTFVLVFGVAVFLCLVTGLAFFLVQVSAQHSFSKEVPETRTADPPGIGNSTGSLPVHDTVEYINNRKVLIKTPGSRKIQGAFLVLHGWNFPPEDWCIKTSLCEKATEKGYCVVLPDMGKSTYHERIYPETRPDWRSFPTRKWLTDTLIPFLQKKYSLLVPEERNFIVGLSTGARGVALVALDLPELFKGAAALSGDYDQSEMPRDNLMTGFYGPYDSFHNRWDTTDNAVFRIAEFATPIYLGHGKSDKVVPPAQTRSFYDLLVKHHPRLKVRLNMPEAGHDYGYWESEVDNILEFFEELN
jgi:enterochelin esterase-like enzyme